MSYILRYLSSYPKLLLLDIVGAASFSIAVIGMPTVLARIIDDALTFGDFGRLYYWTVVMLVVLLCGVMGGIVLAYASSKLPTIMLKNIRNDLYDKIQEYSHHEYEKIGVSSLVTRMTHDTFIVMQFAEQLLRLGIVTPIMMIASVIMILLTSPSLSWVVAMSTPFLVIVICYVAAKSRNLSEKQQEILDKINQYVRENLTGLRVIRAFARENFQEERFRIRNQMYTEISSQLFSFTGLSEMFFIQIIISMIVAIVWLSIPFLQTGELLIGDMVAFIEYSFHALFSFLMFSNLFSIYPRMVIADHRLQEVMDMPISIDPNEFGVTETETHGYLEFDNVTFAYPGATEKPVLHNISFKTGPGETIAFIGSTGSGKSSLVQLIPRFYDVTVGKILIDGVAVRDYNLKALRSKIGFIPQQSLLFTGTIEDNLRYGREDALESELDWAVDVAQARDFIERNDARYQAYLSEGGSNLSGGQKQRLSIARAIVKKADVYIFDDSFSALDYKTDADLRKRLREVTKDSTVLIVSQRVNTVMNADQIIVLDKGEIVGRGKHEELMENNEIYREIANSQIKN